MHEQDPKISPGCTAIHPAPGIFKNVMHPHVNTLVGGIPALVLLFVVPCGISNCLLYIFSPSLGSGPNGYYYCMNLLEESSITFNLGPSGHYYCLTTPEENSFYPRPLRERGSTDGHFLLLFPTSKLAMQRQHLCVSLRYRKRSGGAWVFGSVCHLVLTLDHNLIVI